ncbi:oxidoreductase [Pontimonas salivibrio]|uniref:Oxidoreductase n=1 Tax=Pontimonas salivibrio TaxID=1159327 RepID=A0A2L2BPV3_9MICO|nr:SDR family NAD(P)-dependent oxidoreductase [Pontimonas salivibrio]AVG23701.1 oxidoreductase [Pontimonas salivibrio]
MDIADKVFVVTGAGNGIGREVTLEILRRGGVVAGLDVDSEGLADTAALAEGFDEKFLPLTVDITKRRLVEALPKKIEKALGPVDGVVNVAGIIQPFVRVNDLDFDAIERVMAVNFIGPLTLIKTFLPGLLTRPEAHITNVSSMGSYAPVPGQTIYGASKAAINLLSEGLRSELRESAVHVTVVYPGAIGTNIAANSGLDMSGVDTESSERKTVEPAEAGKAIVEAIEANKKRTLIGSDASTMWWANRVSPDLASNLIYQGMKDLLPPSPVKD